MERIPAARPTVTDEMVEAAANALRNEKMVLGESVFKFEEAFARYTGTKHAISLSSGTNALHLTLEGLGVRGKKVITTTLSFVATANVDSPGRRRADVLRCLPGGQQHRADKGAASHRSEHLRPDARPSVRSSMRHASRWGPSPKRKGSPSSRTPAKHMAHYTMARRRGPSAMWAASPSTPPRT